jgi:hypothetical protein
LAGSQWQNPSKRFASGPVCNLVSVRVHLNTCSNTMTSPFLRPVHHDGQRVIIVWNYEDLYLLELVRYIHLNPLRAGIVRDLKALGSSGSDQDNMLKLSRIKFKFTLR